MASPFTWAGHYCALFGWRARMGKMPDGIALGEVPSETEKTAFFKLDNINLALRRRRGNRVPTFWGRRGRRVTDRDPENLQDGKNAA